MADRRRIVRLFPIPMIFAAVLAPAAPAEAAGNSTLGRYIVENPMPGWTPINQAEVSSEASYINSMETAAVGPSGSSSSTVVEGWTQPGGRQALYVLLVGYASSTYSPQALDQQVAAGAKTAAVTLCAAEGGSLSSTGAVGIPGSHFVLCPAVAGRLVPTGIVWGKANVLAVVLARINPNDKNPLSYQELNAIAVRQYEAMASANVDISGSSGGAIWIAILVGVVALVALGAVVAVFLGRRRREQRPSEVRLPAAG